MSGAGLPEITVPDSTGVTVGLVTSHWYEEITGQLRREALAQAEEVGAVVTDVTVVGALEIPVVVQQLARTHDAVVALGCVIRGETGHYDIVAGESARALMDLSVQRRLPLGNGILTVETEAQALERARVAEMNKGGGAAEAALGVLALKRAAEAARPR